jgi:hypothetical protein
LAGVPYLFLFQRTPDRTLPYFFFLVPLPLPSRAIYSTSSKCEDLLHGLFNTISYLFTQLCARVDAPQVSCFFIWNGGVANLDGYI